MDMTGFSITEDNVGWRIMNQHNQPMGGYVFKSRERAEEVFDCLSRGGEMVDGYLIQPSQVRRTMDVSSGLGIGGTGSDDFNISTERNAPSAPRPHKCGGGQRYDEECAGCGRVTVICNDCEMCEDCHEDES